MQKSRKRLTLEERIIIQTLLGENKSKSYIATQLNRSRSSITREVNNWIRKPSDKYDAHTAHFFAKDDYLNKRNFDEIKIVLKINHKTKAILQSARWLFK